MTVMYAKWIDYKLYLCIQSLVQDPNGMKEEAPPCPVCLGLQTVVTPHHIEKSLLLE